MKKLTSIATISLILAFSGTAFAQSEKYKQVSGEQIKPDLNFSPDIKTYGCTLKVDDKMLHITDISYVDVKRIQEHDVRGKLTVHMKHQQKPITSERTVNDEKLFKKHFIPLLNKCKDHPLNQTKKTTPSY